MKGWEENLTDSEHGTQTAGTFARKSIGKDGKPVKYNESDEKKICEMYNGEHIFLLYGEELFQMKNFVEFSLASVTHGRLITTDIKSSTSQKEVTLQSDQEIKE